VCVAVLMILILTAADPNVLPRALVRSTGMRFRTRPRSQSGLRSDLWKKKTADGRRRPRSRTRFHTTFSGSPPRYPDPARFRPISHAQSPARPDGSAVGPAAGGVRGPDLGGGWAHHTPGRPPHPPDLRVPHPLTRHASRALRARRRPRGNSGHAPTIWGTHSGYVRFQRTIPAT
jgi:hypothetical protein